jgi:hypothetical protein
MKSKNLYFGISTRMKQKQANPREMYNFMARQCACSNRTVFTSNRYIRHNPGDLNK